MLVRIPADTLCPPVPKNLDVLDISWHREVIYDERSLSLWLWSQLWLKLLTCTPQVVGYMDVVAGDLRIPEWNSSYDRPLYMDTLLLLPSGKLNRDQSPSTWTDRCLPVTVSWAFIHATEYVHLLNATLVSCMLPLLAAEHILTDAFFFLRVDCLRIDRVILPQSESPLRIFIPQDPPTTSDWLFAAILPLSWTTLSGFDLWKHAGFSLILVHIIGAFAWSVIMKTPFTRSTWTDYLLI